MILVLLAYHSGTNAPAHGTIYIYEYRGGPQTRDYR